MQKNIINYSIAIALAISLYASVSSCNKTLPKPISDIETLDGPIEELTSAQKKSFEIGSEYFDQVFTEETGLGPIFVSTSCASCHAEGGKGHPFTELVRFNKKIGNLFDPMEDFGGPQLQNQAISGYSAEEIPKDFTGKTTLIAPGITGLGYLEAIDDATLLSLADPFDLNGDGITGIPNYITPPDYYQKFPWQQIDSSGKIIGRFGRKASSLNLLMQTVNAFHEDMGITTDFRMEDLYNYKLGKGTGDDVLDPEMQAANVHSLVFYLQTFKAPPRRNINDADVQQGEKLFVQAGCERCHITTIKTGNNPIEALRYKTIHPYSDLLLHNMGNGLDDGYTEGTALTDEWRTTPLWGLGLTKKSQGGKYFLMHDGRARNIDDAIQLHAGEAQNSHNVYNNFSQEDKNKLIKFLESL